MIHLESDYNNGCHEAVLQHLVATNNERSQSYGDDSYSQEARRLISAACQAPQAQVWFLTGGTQTNATIIDCALQPYEGVLCAETAHINVHEAGAVEFTGHKVIALPAHCGKLDVRELQAWLDNYFADETAEHMVRPGMVYITLPTELGTLYTCTELEAISLVCHRYGLLLYVDGARLAYGLAAASDITLPRLAQLTDIFYIGGTKCGALCGEAVVFPKGDTPAHMLSRIKRHGALLAKSRVVGVQFQALFMPVSPHTPLCPPNWGKVLRAATPPPVGGCRSGTLGVGGLLYTEIGRQAVTLAMRLRHLFVDKLGYQPYIDSPTNQQFYIVPNEDMERLRRHVGFEVWCPGPDAAHTVCRFVTSWATTEEEINTLERLLCQTE